MIIFSVSPKHSRSQEWASETWATVP